MPSSRRRRHRHNPPPKASIEPNKTILVVSEGPVTERQYVEGLGQFIGNTGVRVVFSRQHGVPRTIVEAAKDECQKWRAVHSEEYDEVWCLFDRDSHPQFEASIQIARDRRYHLAVSNPCIELWLWLHHRQSPGARTHTEMQKLLKDQVDAGYDKHIRQDFYFPNLKAAVAAAFQLDKQAIEDREPPFSNPSTSMYKLVLSIASKEQAGSFVEGWEWLASYQ
ncbi:MAG: RloB family protein [Cyanobacteriota bacterium]|jgi:hypothetical protein